MEKMEKFYLLINGKIKIINNINKWGEMRRNSTSIICQTKTKNAFVSTVFLGLDHNFSGQGEPLLFETLVFGGKYDDYMRRYSTLEAAQAGHTKTLKKVGDL